MTLFVVCWGCWLLHFARRDEELEELKEPLIPLIQNIEKDAWKCRNDHITFKRCVGSAEENYNRTF